MTKTKVKKLNPIESVLSVVKKEFGDEALLSINSKEITLKPKDAYSTQFVTIDKAWGGYGIPKGLGTMLHGKEGSGKTTLALTMLASAQKQGAFTFFIDAEYKLNLEWATKCGVDVEKLFINQPVYIEKAMMLIEKTITKAAEAGLESFIVLDSINSCITKKEYENDYDEEEHYGPKAKVYSRVLPKIMPIVKKTNSTLVLVSQIRGGPTGNHIGCGNAVKHHCASILKFVTPMGYKIKSGEDVKAIELEVEFVKNQISAPYKKTRFRITPEGPDFLWAWVELGLKNKLMSKKDRGGYIKIDFLEDTQFRGSNGWKSLLEKQPEILDQLKEKLENV